MVKKIILLFSSVIALFAPLRVHAVIFFATSDPEYNTTAPTGALAGSGWETQGLWGIFLGTAIAPQYFITAKHVGGAIGDNFIIGGVGYRTTGFFDDPRSDLRIWKVQGHLPIYAELYPRVDEVGKNLVVLGRGTQRGSEVVVSGFFGSSTKGWYWGALDGRLRWGENRVGAIVNTGSGGLVGSGSAGTAGSFLKVTFDSAAGPHEAHLSNGDSGGGVFIQDGGIWKLAGINYAVDGPYNTSTTGPGFNAALFDEGGLYKGGEGNWRQSPDLLSATPGAFYAQRISTSLDWIQSILAQPAAEAPVVQSAPTVTGPYSDDSTASVDPNGRAITLPAPIGARIYRLRGSVSLKITSAQVQGGNLILKYE